jgi:hypothetical protein
MKQSQSKFSAEQIVAQIKKEQDGLYIIHRAKFALLQAMREKSS